MLCVSDLGSAGFQRRVSHASQQIEDLQGFSKFDVPRQHRLVVFQLGSKGETDSEGKYVEVLALTLFWVNLGPLFG